MSQKPTDDELIDHYKSENRALWATVNRMAEPISNELPQTAATDSAGDVDVAFEQWWGRMFEPGKALFAKPTNRQAFEAGWNARSHPRDGAVSMTLDEAVTVLNERKHSETGPWEIAENNRKVVYVIAPANKLTTGALTPFEALAIAEKYLRDGAADRGESGE